MINIQTSRLNTIIFIEDNRAVDRAEFGVTPDSEMAQKVEKFLLQGASPESEPAKNDRFSMKSRTILTDAVMWNYLETAKVLLTYGANPNGMYYKENGALKKGRIPLNLAAATGKTDMCRLLIEYGADIFGDRSSTERPATLAFKNGHKDTGKFLLQEIKKQKSNHSNDWKIQEGMERMRLEQKALLDAKRDDEDSYDFSEDDGDSYDFPEEVCHSDSSNVLMDVLSHDTLFNTIC